MLIEEKQCFPQCGRWNSFFRDNSVSKETGENSVNACIGGDKKRFYEVGMWM